MQQQFIEYSHAGTVLEGFLANPARAGERRPALLVSHAWAGRDDFAIGRAKACTSTSACRMSRRHPSIHRVRIARSR